MNVLKLQSNKSKIIFIISFSVFFYACTWLMVYLLKDYYHFKFVVTDIAKTVVFIVITVPTLAFALAFKLTRKRIIQAANWKQLLVRYLIIPVTAGVLMNFLISVVRYIPTLFGEQYIDIAKGQAISSFGDMSLMHFFFSSVLPAMNEETMFKFILLAMVFIAVIYARKGVNISWIHKVTRITYSAVYMRHKATWRSRLIELGVVVAFSFVFAMMHQPNIKNFYMYFVSGALNTYLVLRYGLAAGIMAHLGYNFFAGPCNTYAYDLINYIGQ